MPKILINGVLTDVSLDQIFQDDGTSPFSAPTPPANGRTFTEDDIARARSEEKDKLYGQIERTTSEITQLREQVGGLTAEQQRREAALEREQERLAEEARQVEEKDLDARTLLEKRQQEWNNHLAQVENSFNQRFEEQEQQRLAAEELARKEREFSDLREYTNAQVTANKENIAPQLLQFVTGNTREEIDASISRAVTSTDELTAEMQQLLGQQQQVDPATGQPLPFQQAVAPQVPAPVQPGVTPFSGPSSLDPSGQYSQQITPEQIANMDMTAYSDFRAKMGIGGQNNNRGLYG